MSKYTRGNFDYALIDKMLNSRDGGWQKSPDGTQLDGPRYRLNGAQTSFLVDGRDLGDEKEFVPFFLTRLHDAKTCGARRQGASRFCVIHNPSDHGMREWPLIWHDTSGQLYRICPHFLAHPDPDDVEYWLQKGRNKSGPEQHSCCRQCFPDDQCVVATSTGGEYRHPCSEDLKWH